ncbi:MAG: M20/M25/M40 family metallo-hydrolase [Promethearchaeota archaeon]
MSENKRNNIELSDNKEEMTTSRQEIEIPSSLLEYMHKIIKKVIDEAGCRIPGSKNERIGAEIIANEMKQICDEVDIEEFELAPRAFLGWIKLNVIFVLISFALFFSAKLIPLFGLKMIFYIISTIFVILGLIIMYFEFFNYDEFIDRFYKKKKSQNVIGKIKPKGEMKRIIIFSGHVDSAMQFNLLQYLHYGYPIVSFVGLFSFLIWSVISLFNVVFSFLGKFGIFDETAIWLFIIALPAIVLLWFFVSSSDEKANKVPGAVDNLSSVAITLALGKYIKQHPEIVPNNAEVRLIAFGCEEAGLRGAYRYVSKHYDELKKYDAIDFNMDGIQDPNSLKVIEFEPTTRTRHSKEVVQKILKAATDANIELRVLGNDILDKFFGLISGGTDAAAFSKSKIKAANIVGMNYLEAAHYYHQQGDTLDKIKLGALESVLKIALHFLKNEKSIVST